TFLVDRTNDATDDPAPSLHPRRAQQGLHRYYEPVRRRAPDRYSAPREFSPLGTLPLAPKGSTGAHLPTFHARAADQAHVAYVPDTTRQISGHPPGFSRDSPRRPGFDVTPILLTTLQQRSHPRDCAPSSWSPPDASRAPFPRRSPRRSSANAARGGLEPPPAGRLRRANLHLSHSTTSRNPAYINQPPLCVRGTSGVQKPGRVRRGG